MNAPIISKIYRSGISAMSFTNCMSKTFRFFRNRNQMNMITHQAISPYLYAGLRDYVVIAVCHCETALSRCGNLIFLIVYEIASLIVFPHKDNMTQSYNRGQSLFMSAFGHNGNTKRKVLYIKESLTNSLGCGVDVCCRMRIWQRYD